MLIFHLYAENYEEKRCSTNKSVADDERENTSEEGHGKGREFIYFISANIRRNVIQTFLHISFDKFVEMSWRNDLMTYFSFLMGCVRVGEDVI